MGALRMDNESSQKIHPQATLGCDEKSEGDPDVDVGVDCLPPIWWKVALWRTSWPPPVSAPSTWEPRPIAERRLPVTYHARARVRSHQDNIMRPLCAGNQRVTVISG